MRVISLWLDDARVGCGERRYCVVAEGRRLAHLFYAPTCQAISVPKEALRNALDVQPTRALRRIIRDNLAQRKRLGMRISAKAAALALEGLK